MHQKCYKNGHLEKNHTKCSKLIFLSVIHKHTCEFQHLSTLRESAGDILYIVSTFRRMRCILRIHHKMQRMFLFLGGAFAMTVSDSPSSSESASLCTSESLSLFFDVYFVFFFSVRFCTTVRFVRNEQKENIQIIRKILNEKSMRYREVYSKCYLRDERQPIRLLCFRKITAEFHKVTPVEPFIDCLISCHTTLA